MWGGISALWKGTRFYGRYRTTGRHYPTHKGMKERPALGKTEIEYPCLMDKGDKGGGEAELMKSGYSPIYLYVIDDE